MKKQRPSKGIIFILVVGLIVQAGFIAYSMTSKEKQNETVDIENTDKEIQIENTNISQEIKNIIKNADPQKFDQNLSNYKELLTTLDVQPKFKQEVERLLKEGHKLPDLLTAYSFLNDCFGKIEQLENLSKEKQAGQTWEQIFKTYNTNNQQFTPRAFDSEKLEKLMKSSTINTDDIMIGDRVSFTSGHAFDDIINKRMEGETWKQINEELGIVNSQSKLPCVQVTNEQIQKYTIQGLSQDEVVQAFVLAKKLVKTPEEIISMVKAGYSQEKIYAQCYQEKYY